jgi:hypothetical protein
MQYQQIIITVGSLAVVLPLVWIAIRYYEKRQIQNANTSLFIKKSKSNSFYLIYQFFLWFPLTRGSFHKLSQRYEIICPDDPRKIASKTMTTAFYVFLLWCAEIYIIFILFRKTNDLQTNFDFQLFHIVHFQNSICKGLKTDT